MVNQKQESRVSTFSKMLRVSMIIPALVLIGCQGQNVFKRQSNPTKSFQAAIDMSQTWKPGMGPRPPVTDFDNSQYYCAQNFTINTLGSNPKRAEFHEGVDGAVEVAVTALKKTDFKVSIENAPKGMTIKQLTNGSRYQLLWKPSREDVKHALVKIVITAPELQQKCPFGIAENVNVDVDPGPGVPVASISLQDTIEYGPAKDFEVTVVDQGAVSGKPPVLTVGADERFINNPEAKLKNVSAKEAVFCEEAKMKGNDQTSWTFKCSFKSELLKDAATFIAKPQTVNAIFFVKAKSAVTGLESSQSTKAIQVVFPVVEPKVEDTPADVAPIAAAKTPVQPAGAKVAPLDLKKAKALANKTSKAAKK